MKGLSECKALESNIKHIQVKDIVKEVEDYLKIYSSAGIDMVSIEEPMSGGLRGYERTLRVQSLREQHQTYSSQRHRQGSRRLLEDILVSWDGYQLRSTVSISCPDKFACKLDSLIKFTCSKDLIMSGSLPPIPPPLGASSGNPSSPNVNRVDMMPTNTKPINTTTITSVSQSVDENLPHLLDSRGGSHVTNVSVFDKEDFTTHEGPYDTRDTKIAALRLKFNAFKSLEGEKVNGTFTRLKCLLNDHENNGVTIPQAEVNATFVNNVNGTDFELIPFGAGRRSCPGRDRFGALDVTHAVLATLLQKFELSTPNGAKIDMTESAGLTNDKATPLEVLVAPRFRMEDSQVS
ncbi:retrovirus-related pol polyprotein from transposon TNT 1-94 [Tanacetum coccineum]